MFSASWWGMAAGAIALAAFVPYVVTTLFGKTKPNRATWAIWAVVGLMLAASYYSSIGDQTFWVAISYFVGPLIVAVLALWWGEGGLDNWLDRACLAVAALGVFLWWVFEAPLIALYAGLAVDMSGILPTLKKTYMRPESENLFTWSLFCIANTVNLAIAESWNIVGAGVYPVAIFTGSACMVTIIVWRRFFFPHRV